MYRLIATALCLAHATIAQASGPELHRVQLEAAPLGGDAFIVTGGISNAGFVIGKTGVIVVDAQMLPADAVQAQAAIAKLTTKPVTTLILTHGDVDHVYGLPAWPRGLRIIAQENVKSRIEAMIASPDARQLPPSGLQAYLPTHLVRRSETLTIDGVKIVLTHLRAGHTDGDLIVHLPVQRVAFVGDLLTIGDPNNPKAGLYPVIHIDQHGTSAGWLEVMKAALRLDADVYIGGHGPGRITRRELQAAVAATEKRRGEVERLFMQGKSLAQIKAALDDPAPAAPLFFPTFAETVYRELLQD